MTQPEVINELQRAMVGGDEHLMALIPAMVKRVIHQGIWRQCSDKEGNPFKTFDAFVEYPLYWGLERSVDRLLNLCCESEETQKLIKAEIGPVATHREIGNGRGNNITSTTVRRGTGSLYTLKRLKRDAPELAARVAAGELSANAAAIEAGFRRKPIRLAVCPHCGGKL